MTGNEYQVLATRSNDGKHEERLQALMACYGANVAEILNACLGLSGETGELIDMVKKWVFHEKELDVAHLRKELGDVMWYVAMLCHAMGWELDDVMEININKLIARYPKGFDTNLSNHRQSGDV